MAQDAGIARTDFIGRVAETLARRSESLVEQWLDRLVERHGVRPRSEFPRSLLRQRVPPLIDEIAAVLAVGDAARHDALVEQLRQLADERFGRGHDVQELLEETELLNQMLFDLLGEAVDMAPETKPADVASAAARLHAVSGRAMTVITGAYQELEHQRRRGAARRLDGFGRALAHELKNPIGAAQGAAQLLEEEGIGGVAEQRVHFAGIIHRNLERARELIDEVRSLSRATRDEDDEADREPVDRVIRRAVRDCLSLHGAGAVRVDVDAPLPTVEVDRRLVELVLTNLLGNAVKYLDPAKPQPRVCVRAADHGDHVRIEVEDNGIGIPEGERDRVFERFYRAAGSGLGLAIARDAVERMGGQIGFQSVRGAGSTFFFTISHPRLPVARSAAAAHLAP